MVDGLEEVKLGQSLKKSLRSPSKLRRAACGPRSVTRGKQQYRKAQILLEHTSNAL